MSRSQRHSTIRVVRYIEQPIAFKTVLVSPRLLPQQTQSLPQPKSPSHLPRRQPASAQAGAHTVVYGAPTVKSFSRQSRQAHVTVLPLECSPLCSYYVGPLSVGGRGRSLLLFVVVVRRVGVASSVGHGDNKEK